MLRFALGSMLALTTALAACGGGSSDNITAPPPPPVATVSGNWIGSYSYTYAGQRYNETVTMNLVDNHGIVSGVGTMGSGSSASAETLSGTFNPPNITLIIHDNTSADAVFTGTVMGSTMSGVLNGSGFVNDAITFTRQ